jgi:chaperonin GroEL
MIQGPPGFKLALKAMDRILAGAAATSALLRGVERMTRLLRPTLGPLPRTVAVSPFLRTQPPEILDSAATIARRTVQLPDHFADMGAMMVRHMVWRVFEQVGDGTATAAVLASALMCSAMSYARSGGNPIEVNLGIRRGLEIVRTALLDGAQPIDTPAEIAGVVRGMLGPAPLADLVGEAVDAVGVDGTILVEEARAMTTTLTYAEGMRWSGGYLSSYFVQGASVARLSNPRIFVTDYRLDRADQLVPVLEDCVRAGERRLFVIAPEIRDPVVALLLANRDRGAFDAVVAVKAPATAAELEDIAVACGGRSILRQTHFSVSDVTCVELGRARQAWASRTEFGIVGGFGDRSRVRQRIAAARAELDLAEDAATRRAIESRIGKLAGITATIHVGTASPAEQEAMKARVESAVRTARLALRSGVVPGGGLALVNCMPLLDRLDVCGDVAIGVKLLAAALTEPMRAILVNAGLEAEPIICDARQRGGEVFDVVRREWTEPRQAGLLDPVEVVLAALECSVSLVTTALTADVLIHRKNAPRAEHP